VGLRLWCFGNISVAVQTLSGSFAGFAIKQYGSTTRLFGIKMAKLPISTARRLAESSSHPTYRHAAIVLRGGSVLASGVNHDGRHAEVVALSKLWPSKRRGVTVLSLRIGRDGKLSMAKPCPKCEQFCLDNRVSKVYYTNRKGEIQEL
jgi:deoxycytidylate deaminase